MFVSASFVCRMTSEEQGPRAESGIPTFGWRTARSLRIIPFMVGGSCLQVTKSAFADGFDEALVSMYLKES